MQRKHEALPSNTKAEKSDFGWCRNDSKRLKVGCIREGAVEDGCRDSEQNHDGGVVQFEHFAQERNTQCHHCQICYSCEHVESRKLFI